MNRLVVAAALLVVPAIAFAQEKTGDTPVDRPATKLLKLLRAGEHEKLEKELAALRAAGRATKGYEDQLEEALRLLLKTPELEDDVARWCEKCPRSWCALLVRGQLRVQQAWEARGSGWANSVTKEGWKTFFARLKEARADLEKACELEPKAPHAASELVIVARGLQLGDEENERYFKQAVAADPKFYSAYSHRLIQLMPKWGGTREKLLAFARKPLDPMPDEPALAMLIVEAHMELGQREPGHLEDPKVVKELNAALKKVGDAYPGSADFCFTCADLGGEDPERVRGFMEKAADAGSTTAMRSLFEMKRRGVPADTKLDLSLLKRAALAGDPRAQVDYGLVLARGLYGATADAKAGVSWFQHAVESEDPSGFFCLGRAYFDGVGVDADQKKGVKLIAKSAQRGSPNGAFTLGRMFQEGVTKDGETLVPKDADKGRQWLEYARDLGYAEAEKYLR